MTRRPSALPSTSTATGPVRDAMPIADLLRFMGQSSEGPPYVPSPGRAAGLGSMGMTAGSGRDFGPGWARARDPRFPGRDGAEWHTVLLAQGIVSSRLRWVCGWKVVR